MILASLESGGIVALVVLVLGTLTVSLPPHFLHVTSYEGECEDV
jgi:hypothetical protein